MNFTQPGCGQFIQSHQYQYNPNYMASSQPNNPSVYLHVGHPSAWVSSLMEDIQTIKSKVEKIDNIEKIVNSMNLKLGELENKVKSIESRVLDVEKANTFVSEKYDSQSQELKTAKENLKKFQNTCTTLNDTVQNMSHDQENLKTKLLEYEFRNMRDNLIFYGIPEGSSRSGTMSENCDNLLKLFIKDNLKIDPKDIKFDRVHRLGNPDRSNKKPRPIVAKFRRYVQREQIRQASFDLKGE